MSFKTIVVLSTIYAVAIGGKQSRIVGGSNASDGEYPYQVSIRNRGVHDCGGAILNEFWILTAAHCLISHLPSKMTVVTGTKYLDHAGDIYNVSAIISHSGFSVFTHKNDIGLIKLTKPIIFGPKVQPVNLPIQDVDTGAKLVLTGWGQLDVDEDSPNILQKLELVTISYLRCILSHGALKIWTTNLCTFTQAGQGACYGDSGGPLVYRNQIMGVVSWSKPCATGRPDVFTRVYSYKTWIKEKITE